MDLTGGPPIQAIHELYAYTLAHRNPAFLHQHAVDAFTAQTAEESTKPIAITFALVGLYLHLEKGFTGREVQRAHMALARRKQVWPSFRLPDDRGAMTVSDVLAAPAGPERDAAIHAWCACVWETFRDARPAVMELLRARGIA